VRLAGDGLFDAVGFGFGFGGGFFAMVSLLIVQKLEMTETTKKKLFQSKSNMGKERYVFV
jgi:hypothetical protein